MRFYLRGILSVYVVGVCRCVSLKRVFIPSPPESSALSNTSFPHIIPVLSLLERGVALGEALEPWESAEVGVDVVMYHLEAARTIAHHGGIYRTNVESKLQGESTLSRRPVAVPTPACYISRC